MAKKKILVVDDDAEIRAVVCARLKKDGFEVIQAGDGEAGLALALSAHPDLIVTDIAMPKLDGRELVRRLRHDSMTPVIFLTGRTDDIDRIVGLNLGADDYVTKPFSPPELTARVEAVLRRSYPPPDDGAGTVRVGDLEVDPGRREARVKGRTRPLAPREFDLLLMLAEQKGRVVSRDTIIERFWGLDEGAEVSTRIVDQHVARLRRKLLTERNRVVTVKKAGYRLRLE